MACGRHRRGRDRCRRIRRDLLGLGLHLRRPDRPVRQPHPGTGRTLPFHVAVRRPARGHHHPQARRGLLRRNHRRGHRNAAGQSIRRGARTADRHGPRTRRRNRLRGLRIPQVEPAHRDPGRRVDRPIQWPVRVVVTAGWSTLQGVVFTVCCVISGAVFGGALMWFVQKALAKTGVLDRFESGKADVVA